MQRHFRTVLATLAVAAFVVGSATIAEAQTSTGAKAGATADIPALLKAGALKGRKMVLASWGGAFTAATQKYFVDPFEKATGVKVTTVAIGSGFAAKLAAQEQAHNVQWDFLDAPASDGDILSSLGYVENYPPSLLAALEPLVRPGTLVDHWRLSYGQAVIVIACNMTVVKRCPATPKEFWDVKGFPGPRAIPTSTPYGDLVFAEEAAGVPEDKLFPLNLPLAFGMLEKIKPHVTTWPNGPTAEQQTLADGEVGIAMISSTRVGVLRNEMPGKFEVSWNGANATPDGMVVPKGAPDADVAFAFILWIADHPKLQAGWTSAIYSLTPAKNLEGMLSAKVRDATAITHHVVEIPHDVIANQRTGVQEGFQKLFSGG